jgi:uncharacterized repeat protein (TIGR02543 family)
MQMIRLIEDGGAIGVEDIRTGVTIATPDPSKPEKITVTVLYKQATASYTVQYRLLKLNGNKDTDADYTELIETASNVPAVDGAFVYPEVRSYPYANYERKTSGTVRAGENQTFYVYYTRKTFKLTYNTQTTDVAISPVSRPYGTAVPLPDPTRTGYTFGGWYTDAACTAANRVNSPYTLTADTTLYAKWTASTVNYTIVYLFEKYNDAGTASSFVYDSTGPGTGTVGATVYANDSSIPTKTRKGWEADTTRNAASNVTITADGSSVLYVYYKLKEYTFYFRPGQYGNYAYVTATLKGDTKNGNNNFNYTMTVKLGQDIAASWPLDITNAFFYYYVYYYPAFQGWINPDNNTVYITKRLIVTDDMVPTNGSTITYTASWVLNSEKYTVNYWLQNADNDNYTKSTTYSQIINSNTGGINLGAKDIAGYTYNSSKDDHKYKGSGNNRYIYEYNFYYDRDRYNIDYYYGSTLQKTVNNVKFEANINNGTYNYTPARPADKPAGSTFAGWYADSHLTTPYVFTTMPASNLVLYAKWVLPSYKVNFYEDEAAYQAGTKYVPERTVTYNDFAGAVADPPARANEEFRYWYNAADNSEFYPTQTPIKGDTDVIGRWEAKVITRYRVRYIMRESNGNETEVLPTKEVIGIWYPGEKVTEIAPYITGYSSTEEHDTLIADNSEKELELTFNDETNVITFYYNKKPDHLYYTVHYVLETDPSEHVAPSRVDVEVDGSYTSVTETAVAPTVAEYADFRPTQVTIIKQLGTDKEQNVITFYYTNGAKFTIHWLDMEGDEIPEKVTAEHVFYHEVGETYNLETIVNGYTLDRVEKNGEVTAERSFHVTSNTEEFNINLYYKKDLMLLAHSAHKVYDGTPLRLADDPGSLTADGLKSTHSIASVSFSGEQTTVGISEVVAQASSLVFGGMKNGIAPTDYYNITFLPGYLSVTKINIIVSVEPDRWTGNVYDGEYRATGFTNGDKSAAQYIIITSNRTEDAAAFQNQYLDLIWEKFINELKNRHSDYVTKGTLKNWRDTSQTIPGLQVLNQRDAGDYYVESSVFAVAANAALNALSQDLANYYNVILYVRECRLEILPAPLNITTEGATSGYTGEPLTNKNITVTVRGETVTSSGENHYQLAEGDTVTIRATGSQTTPGESQNIYEIDWGEVKPANYSSTENLGTLKVTVRPITIKANDMVKAWGADDPIFTVTVTYHDDDTNTDVEIPATLTRWTEDGSYTLKLNDPIHGYTDNIALKITRVAGEIPDVYTITPAEDDAAVYNFEITYKTGELTIAIARVSNNGGATWSYHAFLENPSDYTTSSHPLRQGAFDKAKSLSGDVIVETMCRTAEVEPDNDRYQLANPVDFTDGALFSSLLLRTMPDQSFTSIVSRGCTNASDSLFVNNKAFTLENIILDGKKDSYSCKEGNGSLVKVVTGGSLTLMEDAVLQNAKAKNGGAVFLSGGSMTSAGIIQNCEAIVNGGAIMANTAAVTVTGGRILENNALENGGAIQLAENASLTLSGGILQNNSADKEGGAVKVSKDASMIMSGGILQNNSAASGGAVCLAEGPNGGVMTLSGGSIRSNTADNGAGIYLSMDSTLYLSGNPTFSTNFRNDTLSGETNGGTNYTRARQDLYLPVAGNPLNSITVSGAITSVPGSIWVWAEEQQHYEMLKQFAVFDDGVRDTLDNAGATESTISAFRDAQTDKLTLCSGGSYLSGALGEVRNNIYWSGGFDVRFRKVDGYGVELPNAVFTLYESDRVTQVNTAVSADGTTAGDVLFEKVPKGVYFLTETATPTADPSRKPMTYTNGNTYVVFVGDEAKAQCVNYGLTAEDVNAQVSQYMAKYGDGVNLYNQYAIFLLNESGNAVTVPDIANRGIMNISNAQRRTILTKTDGATEKTPLEGAEFTMYYYDLTEVSADTSHMIASAANGVFFVGDLPFGVYYLCEKTAPSGYESSEGSWFCVIVDANGTYQSKGYRNADAEIARQSAYNEANALRNP